MSRRFEVRDPIHGFIALNNLEWEIINQPAFQRLRRIRQLAWTDMVYPSAMHTRFAHSLGVMEVATRYFRSVCERSREILEAEFGLRSDHFARYEQIVRLAALMHDLGHGPFSHAAEELLPVNAATGRRFTHEDYTAAVIQYELGDVIGGHELCRNAEIGVPDVLGVFDDRSGGGPNLVLKGLVAGQMDADRMDYLLRDAYHAGVSYGRYDLDRVLGTVRLCADSEDETYQVGVGEDGIHAVEGLLIARYMMFTQLYFHKTRVIYDHHLVECLRDLLQETAGVFPPPTRDGLAGYLAWHDWRVLGAISGGEGGRHGRILHDRSHYRRVFETSEVPSARELQDIDTLAQMLSDLDGVRLRAEKSWYRAGKGEILVALDESRGRRGAVPLSTQSSVVKGLVSIAQQRLYVPPQHRAEARRRIVRWEGAAR